MEYQNRLGDFNEDFWRALVKKMLRVVNSRAITTLTNFIKMAAILDIPSDFFETIK